MTGKRIKQRQKTADGNGVQKSRNEAEVKIRQQVLPKETLLDVFNYSQRADLDQWSVISRQFESTIRRAEPLRPVDQVILRYHVGCMVYEAIFRNMVHDSANFKELVEDDEDADVIASVFVKCLRFCAVSDCFTIEKFPVKRAFVDRLKGASKNFHCEDHKISLIDIKFARDVNPIELLVALPSFRTLTTNAFDFLGDYIGYNDALLRSLATHGFWDVPMIEGAQVTDEGVLDFAFGNYVDAEGGRRLGLSSTNLLSPQFLAKIVEARRECASGHSIDVHIRTKCAFDISELVANGHEDTIQVGANDDFQAWTFRFEDLPGFELRYTPRQRHSQPHWGHDRRHRRPMSSIHFYQNSIPSHSF